MEDDFDKQEWRDKQAALDKAAEKQRRKDEKAKERAARNAQRKLERLQAKLKKSGELTAWEEEFSSSVTERLDKFGSAFNDPGKGRAGDALSYAQKRVMASLNKKAKADRAARVTPGPDDQAGNTDRSGLKQKKGGWGKSRSGYTPRVRHVEDDMIDDADTVSDEPVPAKPPTPTRKRTAKRDKVPNGTTETKKGKPKKTRAPSNSSKRTAPSSTLKPALAAVPTSTNQSRSKPDAHRDGASPRTKRPQFRVVEGGLSDKE